MSRSRYRDLLRAGMAAGRSGSIDETVSSDAARSTPLPAGSAWDRIGLGTFYREPNYFFGGQRGSTDNALNNDFLRRASAMEERSARENKIAYDYADYTGVVSADYGDKKFGEIWDRGKRIGTVHELYGQDAGDVFMLSNFGKAEQQAKWAEGIHQDPSNRRKYVEELRQQNTTGYDQLARSIAYEDDVASRTGEVADGYVAEGVAAGSALAAGATAAAIGSVFGPAGTLIGGGLGLAAGSIGAWLNQDEIDSTVARQLVQIDRAKSDPDATRWNLYGSYASLAGRTAMLTVQPFGNLTRGVADAHYGTVGDQSSAYSEMKKRGELANAYKVANIGSMVLDGVAAIGATVPRVTYLGAMGLEITAGVGDIVGDDRLGTATVFDPLTGDWRTTQGTGEYAAAWGSVGIDALQTAFARRLGSAVSPRAGRTFDSTAEAQVFLQQASRSSGAAAPSTAYVRNGGMVFTVDSAGKALHARPALLSLAVPSEFSQFVGAKALARAKAATAGRAVSTDDVLYASMHLSGQNKMATVAVNSIGEGMEELAQVHLDSISTGYGAADFQESWDSFVQGAAMGAGMSAAPLILRRTDAMDRGIEALSGSAPQLARMVDRFSPGRSLADRRAYADYALGQLQTNDTPMSEQEFYALSRGEQQAVTVPLDPNIQEAVKALKGSETFTQVSSDPTLHARWQALQNVKDDAIRRNRPSKLPRTSHMASQSLERLGTKFVSTGVDAVVKFWQDQATVLKQTLDDPSRSDQKTQLKEALSLLGKPGGPGDVISRKLEQLQAGKDLMFEAVRAEREKGQPFTLSQVDLQQLDQLRVEINDHLRELYHGEWQGKALKGDVKFAASQLATAVSDRFPIEGITNYSVGLLQIDSQSLFSKRDGMIYTPQDLQEAMSGDFDGDALNLERVWLPTDTFRSLRAGVDLGKTDEDGSFLLNKEEKNEATLKGLQALSDALALDPKDNLIAQVAQDTLSRLKADVLSVLEFLPSVQRDQVGRLFDKATDKLQSPATNGAQLEEAPVAFHTEFISQVLNIARPALSVQGQRDLTNYPQLLYEMSLEAIQGFSYQASFNATLERALQLSQQGKKPKPMASPLNPGVKESKIHEQYGSRPRARGQWGRNFLQTFDPFRTAQGWAYGPGSARDLFALDHFNNDSALLGQLYEEMLKGASGSTDRGKVLDVQDANIIERTVATAIEEVRLEAGRNGRADYWLNYLLAPVFADGSSVLSQIVLSTVAKDRRRHPHPTEQQQAKWDRLTSAARGQGDFTQHELLYEFVGHMRPTDVIGDLRLLALPDIPMSEIVSTLTTSPQQQRDQLLQMFKLVDLYSTHPETQQQHVYKMVVDMIETVSSKTLSAHGEGRVPKQSKKVSTDVKKTLLLLRQAVKTETLVDDAGAREHVSDPSKATDAQLAEVFNRHRPLVQNLLKHFGTDAILATVDSKGRPQPYVFDAVRNPNTEQALVQLYVQVGLASARGYAHRVQLASGEVSKTPVDYSKVKDLWMKQLLAVLEEPHYMQILGDLMSSKTMDDLAGKVNALRDPSEAPFIPWIHSIQEYSGSTLRLDTYQQAVLDARLESKFAQQMSENRLETISARNKQDVQVINDIEMNPDGPRAKEFEKRVKRSRAEAASTLSFALTQNLIGETLEAGFFEGGAAHNKGQAPGVWATLSAIRMNEADPTRLGPDERMALQSVPTSIVEALPKLLWNDLMLTDEYGNRFEWYAPTTPEEVLDLFKHHDPRMNEIAYRLIQSDVVASVEQGVPFYEADRSLTLDQMTTTSGQAAAPTSRGQTFLELQQAVNRHTDKGDPTQQLALPVHVAEIALSQAAQADVPLTLKTIDQLSAQAIHQVTDFLTQVGNYVYGANSRDGFDTTTEKGRRALLERELPLLLKSLDQDYNSRLLQRMEFAISDKGHVAGIHGPMMEVYTKLSGQVAASFENKIEALETRLDELLKSNKPGVAIAGERLQLEVLLETLRDMKSVFDGKADPSKNPLIAKVVSKYSYSPKVQKAKKKKEIAHRNAVQQNLHFWVASHYAEMVQVNPTLRPIVEKLRERVSDPLTRTANDLLTRSEYEKLSSFVMQREINAEMHMAYVTNTDVEMTVEEVEHKYDPSMRRLTDPFLDASSPFAKGALTWALENGEAAPTSDGLKNLQDSYAALRDSFGVPNSYSTFAEAALRIRHIPLGAQDAITGPGQTNQRSVLWNELTRIERDYVTLEDKHFSTATLEGTSLLKYRDVALNHANLDSLADIEFLASVPDSKFVKHDIKMSLLELQGRAFRKAEATLPDGSVIDLFDLWETAGYDPEASDVSQRDARFTNPLRLLQALEYRLQSQNKNHEVTDKELFAYLENVAIDIEFVDRATANVQDDSQWNNVVFNGTNSSFFSGWQQSANSEMYAPDGALASAQAAPLQSTKKGTLALAHTDIYGLQEIQNLETGWESDLRGVLSRKVAERIRKGNNTYHENLDHYGRFFNMFAHQHYVALATAGEVKVYSAVEVMDLQLRAEWDALVKDATDAKLIVLNNDQLHTLYRTSFDAAGVTGKIAPDVTFRYDPTSATITRLFEENLPEPISAANGMFVKPTLGQMLNLRPVTSEHKGGKTSFMQRAENQRTFEEKLQERREEVHGIRTAELMENKFNYGQNKRETEAAFNAIGLDQLKRSTGQITGLSSASGRGATRSFQSQVRHVMVKTHKFVERFFASIRQNGQAPDHARLHVVMLDTADTDALPNMSEYASLIVTSNNLGAATRKFGPQDVVYFATQSYTLDPANTELDTLERDIQKVADTGATLFLQQSDLSLQVAETALYKAGYARSPENASMWYAQGDESLSIDERASVSTSAKIEKVPSDGTLVLAMLGDSPVFENGAIVSPRFLEKVSRVEQNVAITELHGYRPPVTASQNQAVYSALEVLLGSDGALHRKQLLGTVETGLSDAQLVEQLSKLKQRLDTAERTQDASAPYVGKSLKPGDFIPLVRKDDASTWSVYFMQAGHKSPIQGPEDADKLRKIKDETRLPSGTTLLTDKGERSPDINAHEMVVRRAEMVGATLWINGIQSMDQAQVKVLVNFSGLKLSIASGREGTEYFGDQDAMEQTNPYFLPEVITAKESDVDNKQSGMRGYSNFRGAAGLFGANFETAIFNTLLRADDTPHVGPLSQSQASQLRQWVTFFQQTVPRRNTEDVHRDLREVGDLYREVAATGLLKMPDHIKLKHEFTQRMSQLVRDMADFLADTEVADTAQKDRAEAFRDSMAKQMRSYADALEGSMSGEQYVTLVTMLALQADAYRYEDLVNTPGIMARDSKPDAESRLLPPEFALALDAHPDVHQAMVDHANAQVDQEWMHITDDFLLEMASLNDGRTSRWTRDKSGKIQESTELATGGTFKTWHTYEILYDRLFAAEQSGELKQDATDRLSDRAAYSPSTAAVEAELLGSYVRNTDVLHVGDVPPPATSILELRKAMQPHFKAQHRRWTQAERRFVEQSGVAYEYFMAPLSNIKWAEKKAERKKEQVDVETALTALSDRFNLDPDTQGLLAEQMVRLYLGLGRDADGEGAPVFASEITSTVKAILKTVENGDMPLSNGAIPMLPVHIWKAIYHANKKGAHSYRPTDTDGKQLTEWSEWVDWMFGSMPRNATFDPMFNYAYHGMYHTYRFEFNDPFSDPVALSEGLAEALLTKEGELEPVLNEFDRETLQLENGEYVPISVRELFRRQDPEVLRNTAEAQRKRVDRSLEAAGERRRFFRRSGRTMRSEGRRIRTDRIRTNEAVRFVTNLRLATSLANPALWTSSFVENWFGTMDQRATELMKGQTLSRMFGGKLASSITGDEAFERSTRTRKHFIENVANDSAAIAMLYDEFPVSAIEGSNALGRVAAKAASAAARLSDGLRWMPKQSVMATIYDGMLEYFMMVGADRPVDVLLREAATDLPGFRRRYPEAVRAGINRYLTSRNMKPTTIGLGLNAAIDYAQTSPSSVVQFGSLVFTLPMTFRGFFLSQATKILGLQVVDQAAALLLHGRKKWPALYAWQKRMAERRGDSTEDVNEYFDTSAAQDGVDLTQAFLQSGMSFTRLFVGAMILNSAGLVDGDEDEETKLAKKRLARFNIAWANDPLSYRSDRRDEGAIDVAKLPLLGPLLQGVMGDTIVTPHWTVKPFLAPLLGMARFVESGNFQDVIYGFQDGLGSLPLFDFNRAMEVYDMSMELAQQQAEMELDGEASQDAREELQYKMMRMVFTYESLVLENSFVNALYRGLDEFDRDPYVETDQLISGETAVDKDGNPLPTDQLTPYMNEDGEVSHAYVKRQGMGLLLRQHSENNFTLAALASIVTLGGVDSDFIRYNMAKKQPKYNRTEMSEDEALAFYLEYFDENGTLSSRESDVYVAVRNAYSGLSPISDPANKGMFLPKETRVNIANRLLHELTIEAAQQGMDEWETKQYLGRVWWGNGGRVGLYDIINDWSLIPESGVITYDQLNTSYVPHLDGTFVPVGDNRASVANLFGFPFFTTRRIGLPNLGQDERLNATDAVHNLNTGRRALQLVPENVDNLRPEEIAEDLEKAFTTAIEDAAQLIRDTMFEVDNDGYPSGWRNWSRGGGYRNWGSRSWGGRSWGRRSYGGGGGSSYPARTYTPPRANMPYASDVRGTNLYNMNIRRATIRRERYSSQRGRLKDWQ